MNARGWLAAVAVAGAPLTAAAQSPAPASFPRQIVAPDLAADEHAEALTGRPEIFVQTRLARVPLANTPPADAPVNVRLTRLETRWAGRVADRVGVGVEVQLQPALDGHPEELVNDAFVEFYAPRSVTVRVGQFIKPFGFDIQQSSFDREYPERGMFAGYFFPGQRDRGVMVAWRPGTTETGTVGTQVFAALLNGNRFFNDNDGRLDTLLRVRHVFASAPAAVGTSVQLGSQIVPESFAGHTRVRLYGVDAQYATSVVGVRAEWVHGTRPSTLLSLDPVFTDAFDPHAATTGATVATVIRLTADSQVFARFDRLAGDPMTGHTVRATDVGYRRLIGAATRVSADLQWKNAPTANDDAVNTRAQITLGVEF